MLTSIFFALLTQFAAGLLFTTLFVSLSEIGKFYFRVTGVTAAVLILFALMARPFGPVSLVIFGDTGSESITLVQRLTYLASLLALALLIAHQFLLGKWHRSLLAAACAASLAGIVCFGLTQLPSAPVDTIQRFAFVANGVTAALLSGSVLGAMITGHWYLVQHRLSIKPLTTTSLIFNSSVILRIILIVGSLVIFWNTLSPLRVWGEFNFEGIVFFCRFLIGLILPFVLGIMIWKTVKLHSTQSATGILYATVVLIMLGETFAQFIFYSTGIPF